MNAFIDFISWFTAEHLRADGSNFIDWYGRLRVLLQPSNVIYTVEMPLAEGPNKGLGLDLDQ